MQSYSHFFLNGILIDSVTSHKDLGITFDNQLKLREHTTGIIAKANHLLEIIKKSFDNVEPDMLVKLFTVIVRPILEYGNSCVGINIYYR